jgi:hypothetical protein
MVVTRIIGIEGEFVDLIFAGTVVDAYPIGSRYGVVLVACSDEDIVLDVGTHGTGAFGVGEGTDPGWFGAFVEGRSGGGVGGGICVGYCGEGEGSTGKEGHDDGEGEMHIFLGANIQ